MSKTTPEQICTNTTWMLFRKPPPHFFYIDVDVKEMAKRAWVRHQNMELGNIEQCRCIKCSPDTSNGRLIGTWKAS